MRCGPMADTELDQMADTELDELRARHAELKHAAKVVLDAYEVAGMHGVLEDPMQQLQRIVAPSLPVRGRV